MANDSLPEAMDVVFVDSLRVAANIGRDCWGRAREQPVELTVYLHLKESYLGAAGESDNVVDSVHYGHLTKAISNLIKSRTESDTPGFDNADDLTRAVTERAFELAGEAAAEVRVVLDVPKMILLATGLSVDVTTAKGTLGVLSKKVLVKDIVIPVIIGVNPPEREVKQRVVVNIIFHENTSSVSGPAPNYQETVSRLSKDIEASSYLTLEKFVMQIVRSSCLSSERISAVTVRAQKPSALSFAQSSGVEITRRRESFLKQ
ncbi:hypothetical protein GALMADRAFT_119053 [Galerina marginata CBS 339.88]|uniref:dihydroneopterin aldolase n=1 Tax=Galerina marginata (strain CBS 339.88) TaxID=685588 RepID=A0A067TGM8_GALM3|nr:hypothetical protein GALMADRAFT_119053 [Galerina marginata CBS 339.88]